MTVIGTTASLFEHFDFAWNHAGVDHAEVTSNTNGHVNNAASDVGAAIIDADDGRPVISEIGHAHTRAEPEKSVRGCVGVVAQLLPAGRGRASVGSDAVVGGLATIRPGNLKVGVGRRWRGLRGEGDSDGCCWCWRLFKRHFRRLAIREDGNR